MNVISRIERQAVNRTLGIGLAVFIVVYFFATLCFIVLE